MYMLPLTLSDFGMNLPFSAAPSQKEIGATCLSCYAIMRRTKNLGENITELLSEHTWLKPNSEIYINIAGSWKILFVRALAKNTKSVNSLGIFCLTWYYSLAIVPSSCCKTVLLGIKNTLSVIKMLHLHTAASGVYAKLWNSFIDFS